MKWVFRFEGETGKVYLLPFSEKFEAREVLHTEKIKDLTPSLLPSWAVMLSDDLAVFKGAPINFIASYFCGLAKRDSVILGDALIMCVSKSGYGYEGLDLTQALFLSYSLEQAFGIRVNVPAA